MSFIYCIDELTKNNLISKGYKLLKQEYMKNKITWIFIYKPSIQFDISDNTKYFISDKLLF